MISILLVDDEPALLDVACLFLERNKGFKVDTALSAQSALDLLNSGSYEVIISDYEMPEMNGIEFLKIVRNKWKDLPFIIFTGKGREDVVIEALNAGADFYLQKGGNPRAQFFELQNMVYQALKRYHAEKNLVRSERKLHDIIDHLPYATFAIDESGVVIAWNKAIEDLTGVLAAEMIGKGDYEYSIPFYGKRRPLLIDFVSNPGADIERMYANIRREGNTLSGETPIPKPRGNRAVLWGKATPLYDEAGNPSGAIESILDITGQRKIEKALSDSETKYHRVMEQAHVAVLVAQDGLIKYLNPFGLDIFGSSLEDLLEKPFTNLIHPDDRQVVIDSHKKRFSPHPPPDTYSFRIIDRNGDIRVVELNVIVIEWDQRPATLNFIFDITDRLKAEDALKKSEERLKLAIEAIHMGVWEVDFKSGIFQFSSQAAKILGYEDEELAHTTEQWLGMVHPDDIPYVMEHIELHKRGESPYFEAEYRMRHKDGHYIWIRAVGRATEYDSDGAPAIVTGIMWDITDQKHTEEALRTSEKRFRDLAEMLPQPIFESDLEGRVTYANREALQAFGYSKEEIESGISIFDSIAPSEHQRIQNRIRAIVNGSEPEVADYTAVKKDGSVFPVKAYVAPIRDGERVTGLRGFLININEMKKAENALKEANKKLNLMNSITRHDILNQLMVIRGYLDLSEGSCTEGTIKENLNQIEHSTDSIGRRIEFTKDYQDIGSQSPGWYLLDEVIRNAESILPKSIEIECSLGNLEIYADPLIEKVFYNILENAARYCGQNPRVLFHSISSGKEILLVCEDNGPGIPDEDKERIFEAGYGKNTGYGLFLAREILSITGLSVRESGIAGKGSRFEIHIPDGEFRYQV
jgi:PAS domain S-box-containing protein